LIGIRAVYNNVNAYVHPLRDDARFGSDEEIAFLLPAELGALDDQTGDPFSQHRGFTSSPADVHVAL
jgi:hypothetical protein